MNWCGLRSGACLHSIYVISGPSGVYVGNTTLPARRWYEHQWAAARKGGHGSGTLAIHGAMRRTGIRRHRFDVFAQAIGCRNASRLEVDVIHQLRADGERVINVKPKPLPVAVHQPEA